MASKITVICSWPECDAEIEVAPNRIGGNQKNFCQEHKEIAHLENERNRTYSSPYRVAWVATNTWWRGFVKSVDGWKEAAAKRDMTGLIIRSKSTGLCKKWDGSRFENCDTVEPDAGSRVDIFDGCGHSRQSGASRPYHFTAAKVG